MGWTSKTGTYWGSVRCAGKTLVRCIQMTDTRFISVEKRTDTNMGLDFLCSKNSSTGEWFRTTVRVRQGCLLSPTLLNIFL